MEYGYAVKTEDGYALTVVIFETGLADRVFGQLEEADQQKLLSIGKSIRSIMDNVGYIPREYIFDRAMVDGWIRFDSETTSKVVGAYIYR